MLVNEEDIAHATLVEMAQSMFISPIQYCRAQYGKKVLIDALEWILAQLQEEYDRTT